MDFCKFTLVCVSAITITGCDQEQPTESIPKTEEARPIESEPISELTAPKSEEETTSKSQLPELDLADLEQITSKQTTRKSTQAKATDSITNAEQQKLERYLLSSDKLTTALKRKATIDEVKLLRLEKAQALREVANEATPSGKYYQAKLIYLQQGKRSQEEFAWYVKSAKEGYVPAFDQAMLNSGSIETENAWSIVQIHASAVAIESGAVSSIPSIGNNSTERHDWLHKCIADRLNQPIITDDFRRAVLSETENLIETISKFGYTYKDGTILSDPDLKIWKKEKIRITKSLGL